MQVRELGITYSLSKQLLVGCGFLDPSFSLREQSLHNMAQLTISRPITTKLYSCLADHWSTDVSNEVAVMEPYRRFGAWARRRNYRAANPGVIYMHPSKGSII
jgi:hypothetical protein